MFLTLLFFIGDVFVKADSENIQNFATRLNNSFGNSSKEGRLEIYYSGRWGTVCDDSFSNDSASVACASLGFANIGTVIGNRHGNGSGSIWLDEVTCTGTETGIERCSHRGWGVHDCSHIEDVSISCEDLSNFAVRLINSIGNNSNEGRLEIYYSGSWGTVCGDRFTDENARVACASLRYGYIGSVIGNLHGVGTGTIWLDDVSCNGIEHGIEQCVHNAWGVHNCGHHQDISIICECGNRTFYGPTGQISSPNYPLRYVNGLDCNSYIRVASGHSVIITFLAFRTELFFDWVTITCESGNPFKSPRYSGLVFPAVLTISSCDLVNVSFHTNSYTTYTGFSLTYDVTSDKTYQNLIQQVLSLGALLGVAVYVLTIVVMVVIPLSRKRHHLKANTATDVVLKLDDNEHELRQREVESNRYEVDFGNESEYDSLEPSHRSLTDKPVIYQELKIKK